MSAIAVRDAPTLHVSLGDPRLVAEMLLRTDAIDSGHFELLGGDHSDAFVRFSRIATQPQALETTARSLLPSVSAWMPDIVVAPTTAGVALAALLAKRLSLQLALAEVGGDGRPSTLQDPDLVAGRRVLLVNDVVTTGDGMTALADLAHAAGAAVAGGAWFLTRGHIDVSERVAAPTAAIGELLLQTWSQHDCPLCAAGEELMPALEVN